MILPCIKEGARGVVLITDYQTIGGECRNTRETRRNFEIVKVRTQDFIILADGKRMYCKLPKNKKDGSEAFWPTEDGEGFVRQYKDNFTDSRGLIENMTETVYLFNA